MRDNFSPNGLALYRAKLEAHDWLFQYSDDPHVYAKGRNELAELNDLSRQLDPDKVIWFEIKARRAPHA